MPMSTEPPRGSIPRRMNLRPGRFAREILACLQREVADREPDAALPYDVFGRVNRLLLRGGRALAHAPGQLRARPFPGDRFGAVTTRDAVHALLKLLHCADPLFSVPPEERLALYRLREAARRG